MQFPAELADITDSERAHRLPRDADLAAPEPWERVVAEIRIGQSTQEFSGTRSARSEEHRLNSSHDQISYAVFCLKKKKKDKREMRDRPKGKDEAINKKEIDSI